MRSSGAEIGLCLIYAGWLVLSVANQFRWKWVQRIKAHDLCHLIPNWRFFAPNPASRDFQLEYRVGGGGVSTTPWTRVATIASRPMRCVVWHPEKRRRKSFNTLVRRLMRIKRERGSEQAARSVSYLLLLHHVQERHAPDCQPVQFRIVSCQEFNPLMPLRVEFTSDWHAPRFRKPVLVARPIEVPILQAAE